MKKYGLIILALMTLITACKENNTKVDTDTPTVERIEKKENTEISDMSVFNLPSTWTNQNNKDIELAELQGDVLVMVMIYTSCQAACPRLVADMRHIEQQIQPETNSNKVKYVLVSIDPEVDTPERLKDFSIENKMDGNQWIFLRSTEENTREFAATLAVNYKRISPIDFSHSNIISVFNTKGELTYQQEGLGIDYEPTINEIKKQLSNI